MKKEAIILAGGLGTRLAHVVSDTQKVMAPIGGVPFLEYLFDSLIDAGFDTFVLAVSYLENTVREHFGNAYRNAEIVYSEETEPLGTGGAIRQALSYCVSDAVPVINGDTFFVVDFAELERRHRETGAEITVCVKQMENFSRYGTLTFDADGRVTAFREKQETEKGYINGGIYYVNKSVFDGALSRFSFERDVLEPLSRRTYALPSEGYFIDIGIPEDYFDAQTQIPLLLGKNVFRAAFIDRDGTINEERHHLHKPEDFAFYPGVPRALEKLREHGYLIIVVTNQAGVAKGLYTEDDVRRLHEFISDSLRGSARIDAFYYCPFHEEATVDAYRRASDCRKPAPGMLLNAVRDFAARGVQIDLSRSVMIGDTENDLAAGISAGVGKTVLVRTGHGAQADASRADIVADDLPAAAEMLLRSEELPREANNGLSENR